MSRQVPLLSTHPLMSTFMIWASGMCMDLNTFELKLLQPLSTQTFRSFEIHTEEGSTTTMISDGVDQEVDDVAEEEKRDDQAGHQTQFIFCTFILIHQCLILSFEAMGSWFLDMYNFIKCISFLLTFLTSFFLSLMVLVRLRSN